MLHPTTFRDLLRDADANFGEAHFLIDDPLLGPISYTELARFSCGLESELDEISAPVGAPVAVVLQNSGLAALLFLSVIASGRVLVPINPISTKAELEYMLGRCGSALVLTDLPQVASMLPTTQRLYRLDNHREFFASMLRKCTATTRRPGATAAFVGEVVFTSGSTGFPKGVVLSERSLISDAAALAGAYDLRRTDRFLTVCPLFHNSGQIFTTLACALVGGSTIAVKSSTGMRNFWQYVSRYRCDWSLGMVSFLSLLLHSAEQPTHGCSMRGLLTGGSAIDAELVRSFETRFGIPVRTVYGLTETASISTCEPIDPTPRSLGSSGRPLPICKVKIAPITGADADQATHPFGRPGEILISGDNIFDRYIGDVSLTRERIVEGWVHTGDVGYFDSFGNLFVVDRLDSMLIVGGENVYPAEIERLCVSLPGAAQVMLAGVDHAVWGKELVLVYKADGDGSARIPLWHQVLSNQVTALKLPKRYVSVESLGFREFPYRENGKLDRRAVANALGALSREG